MGATEPTAARRRDPHHRGGHEDARRYAHRGPVLSSGEVLAGKGTAPQPARSGPRRRTGPQPDLAAADRFLHALRGLRYRPTSPTGVDREHLAALRHRRPGHRHQQRPHRGLQQNRQARRQDRVRVQEHRKPETPDTPRLHPRITPGANQNPRSPLIKSEDPRMSDRSPPTPLCIPVSIHWVVYAAKPAEAAPGHRGPPCAASAASADRG